MEEIGPRATFGHEVFARVSKDDLAEIVLDLLAEQTGHADDATADEIRAAFLERHETLRTAGIINRRLPARLRSSAS